MITRSQLAAEAIAAWTIDALRQGETSLARQELPTFEVRTFLQAFARAKDLPGNISLALVGFEEDARGLETAARKAGATVFGHFASDLHVAAAWRNNRSKHPIIVAYAHGTVPGVNTLKHFAQATSRELTITLLRWAAGRREFCSTRAHERLLGDLQSLIEDADAFSFEQIRLFLELWSSRTGASAPRDGLTALGLLPDPNLFAEPGLIRARLERNIAFRDGLRDKSTGQMDAVRKKLQKSADRSGKAESRARLRTFDKLQAIRRTPSATTLGALTLDDAIQVFAPAAKDEGKAQKEAAEPESRPLNERRLQRAVAEALLDDRAEELKANADALSKSLRVALDADDESGADDQWQTDVVVSGESQAFSGELDRRFVSWVRHFCKESVWGGLIETTVPDLRRALEDFDRPGTLLLNPDLLFQKSGQQIGLEDMLRAWEDDLQKEAGQLGLLSLWREMRSLRGQLLGSLEELTHFPLEWFAGRPELREVAERYLKVTGQLFGIVAKHFGKMAQNDPTWAKTTLEGLLALDIVQVRVQQPDGKTASKAVLLPMHPLHLWRYWRLSNILRGLGKDLNDADRPAVIQEASEPVQFLSVIYASKLPGGRGASQVLPVSNDLYRLATFENLRNAYSGPDGQPTLAYAVERFASLHRHHVNPIRVVLVNPPQPGTLLLDLVKLIDAKKRSLIPRLRVEVRGTLLQAPRLREALLFDTREREIIEEKVAAGRLDLLLNRDPKSLDEILEELRRHPAHIVAVFDEAPVTVRRGGAGQRLPMSPFCIRRKVAFHKRSNELRLEPTAGEPPFLEFIELVKHVEGNEGEGTPYAWPESEALRKSVDNVVTPVDFGAHWFFLADRALPEEGEMVAQRFIRKRDGQRQVLLAARDYESLARVMLPVFEDDTPNLLMPVPRLQELLGEGAHLIGAGLLEVIKSQEGRVIPAKVIGLMGTLLAARDYLRKHPGALLVSTDSQLARTWLRLGTQGDRCDLLALRAEGQRLRLECIEVKTTKGKPRVKGDPEIGRAFDQLAATLAAVREGLGDTTVADAGGHYLAAPRNEMLKEVLVQGCMGRYASNDDRGRWAAWLDRLFGATAEVPELCGVVVDVALGSAEVCRDELVETESGKITLTHINEIDVQRLLEPEVKGGDLRKDEPGGDARGNGSEPPPVRPPAPSAVTKMDKSSTGPASLGTRNISLGETEIPSDGAALIGWPPRENAFGLIGQDAAASKLYNKAQLARGTGRRFTDTLFIGSAGVGKSSLARAVAKSLVAEEPLFFSGTDLPRPLALIDKLRERKKLPSRGRGRLKAGKCLVFIDEVHALAKSTATALLSALDDARIATVGGVEYDFGDVVFIAATTDKGMLSDAFVSRMDLIHLRNYSLAELAGIIYHHGRKLFGGHELPKEVCIEVAARSRCNPRRAVRSLENDLLAEFYTKLSSGERDKKGSERSAASLMTPETVAAYYDTHGIDLNGLDDLCRKTLSYLKAHGAVPEDRLCRGLRISNRADFVEVVEYLSRLGLVTTGHQGRQLTSAGRQYLAAPTNLRDRI